MTSMTTADGWGYGVDHEPRTRSEHQLKKEREALVSSMIPIHDEIRTTEMYRDGFPMWYWDRVSKAKERENEEITAVPAGPTPPTHWGWVWGGRGLSHPLVQEFLSC